MFSEYASRFLAQSQSRLLPHSDETRKKGHGRLMQQPGSSRFPSSRSFLQRATLDPYQPTASQISNLPLGSRNLAQHAPLFYSATDNFCEEDDEAEHEREIADFYALQKSRRNFGSSHLKASSEIDEDDDHSNSVGDYGTSRYGRYCKAQGIRSSWRAGTSCHGEQEVTAETVPEAAEVEDGPPMDEYNIRARENLVDVHLEDSLRSASDGDRADSSETGDDNPPSVQRFRGESQSRKGNFGIDRVQASFAPPLVVSARSLARMTTLSPTMINSSLHPRSYSRSHESLTPLIPYRLSKLILHAARLMMSLALGFGGWVTTARDLGVSSGSGVIRGSVYAYVVGLIAGTIGWSVLGAIESVIADIVDASVICWSSEVGAYGREARYCREAGWLFGEGPSLDSSFARHREAP
ncbi:hypothetical protein AFCA_007712 [Aspergillus flavus]|nr:hypothetical protein AFCA_007712 [Aspergillus flavus]